ncbi:MAG TPA: phage tail tape measure protein, partial [Flavobacteriales bacterium]|nr:phage tail tape measure protein [Flavobacteriales bacterium]
MAKETTPDRIQLYVVIDGTPARKELAELTQGAVALKQQQKALREEERLLLDQRKAASKAGNSDEVARLTKELFRVRGAYSEVTEAIRTNDKAQENLRNGMGAMDLSLNELRKKAQALRATWSAGIGSKEALLATAKELELVEQRIQVLGTTQGRALARWEEERRTIDRTKWSLEQLGLEQKRLQMIYDSAEGDSGQKERAGRDLRAITEEIRMQTTEAGRLQAEWLKLRNSMTPDQMNADQLKLETDYLEKLASSMSGAERAASGLDPRIDDLKERLRLMTTEAGRAEAEWEKLRGTMTLDQMTGDQLKMEQAHLEKLAGSMTEAERAAAGLDPRLDEVRERLRLMNTEAGRAEAEWAKLRGSMKLEDMSIEQLKLEKKYLEDLVNTARRTGAEFNKLEGDLLKVEAVLKESTNETARADRQWESMRKSMKLTDMSMEELAREIEHLKRVKDSLHPESDAAKFQLYSNSLKAAEAQHKRLQTGMGPLARMWQEVKMQAMSAGAVIGGLFAGGALISGARNMIKSASDLSDSIANVRKTTGLAMPAVKEIVTELGKFDTRTSRAELLALASDAGKLGISAKEDVMAFVRAGNQINVALGEDLGEDAIKNIGKLVDLFKLKEQFGLEQSMLKVGSAINQLGMSSTASEGYMVDFMKRMGGIAPQANITIQQVLALGATLDSLGQTSEVSTTSLTKMFLKMAQDSKQYAGIAGMEVTKFTELINKNALEAFIAVLEGSKKTKGGLSELTATLGDMGVDGTRAAAVFGALADNTVRLREQIDLSNQAFADGSSVTSEYEIRNTNLAAAVEKLGKEFNRMLANNAVIDFMTGLVGVTRNAIDWIQRNSAVIEAMAKTLAIATSAWVTYRIAGAAWLRLAALQTTATTVLANAQMLFSRNTITAGRALIYFRTALSASIPGLVIAAITTAVGLFASFGKELSAAALAVSKETSALQVLYIEILNTNRGTDERRKLIQQLKDMYPQYLANINADTVSNEALGKAVAFVNDQLINKAVLAQADEALEEQNAETAEKRMERLRLERELRTKLAEASKETGVAIPTDVPDLREMALQFDNAAKAAGKSGSFVMKEVVNLQRQLSEAFAAESQEQRASTKLAEERVKLMGELGIHSDTEAKKAGLTVRSLQEVEKEIRSIENALANPRTQANEDVGLLENKLASLRKERDALKVTADEVVATVATYNAKIKALQEEQENASTDKEYNRIAAEIKRMEALRDRITGGSDKAKAKQEKTAEDLDKLLEEYRSFEGELSRDRLSDDAKELADLDAKHREELEKVKEQQAKLIAAKKLSPIDAQTDIELLGDNQAKERIDLLARQGDARQKVLADQNKKLQEILGDGHNEALQADVAFYDAEIRLAEEQGLDVTALLAKKRDAELALYAANADALIAQETEKYADLITLAKEKLAEYDRALEEQEEAGVDPTAEQLAERQRLSTGILQLESAEAKAIANIRRKLRQEEKAARRGETLEMRQEYVRRLQNFSMVADAVGNLISSITR